MELVSILKEERIKEAKKVFKVAYETYIQNREKALQGLDVDNFKKELRRIKEKSIENLDELKKKTIENLKKNGVKVFEAKTSEDALKIAEKLIPRGEVVVKSKSNVIHEIGLVEKFEKRNNFIETDCGDFIVQICNEKSSHPVTPALHIPIEKIVERIYKKFKVKVKPKPEEITKWVKKYLREKILKAKIGLTGANVISAEGSIFIIENEGNISLVSRIPEKHIIITSIDKIVSTNEDAMKICKALSIWGTGTSMTSYVNIISSPSKTADIQKKLVYGMHGAKEVYLILVDNGRSKIAKSEVKELLYCINCGACLYSCPVYRQIFDNYGYIYFGGRGISLVSFIYGIKKAFESGLYYCSTCSACKEICPLSIDVPKLIRLTRKLAADKDLLTETNRKMLENLEVAGNPFGEELKEGKIPDKLYCC